MSSIKRYMKFVKPYKWQIIITILIGIVKFSIPLITPALLGYVIDDVIGANALTKDEQLRKLFMLMALMFFIFVVVRPPVEYYRQYYAQWTASKILFDIRDKMFGHIQKLSFKYYSNAKGGEIISRVINDVEETKNFVITGLMNVWLDLVTILIAVGIMLAMDVELTLISLLLLPLYGFSIKYFFGKLRGLTRERSQALAEVQGYLHERVQGMAVIKSFAIEDHEQKQFNRENGNFLKKALTHTSWNAKSFAAVNTITDVAPLIVILFAGYQVISGNLTLGTMVAFYGYIDLLYAPLRRLMNSSTTLTQSLASMDRVFEFLDVPYDIEDRPNANECKDVQGTIKFENVSFSYGEDENLALKNINLEVKRGETVALVGMSGGGKSSLVSLIPRFYDVTEGRILLDGIDIRDVKVRSLRDNIGMVMQDSILFSDSVRANILLGKPEATDKEVYEAAKAANAHDFILGLPSGYETKVGERGVKLSGGQKQRVSIARVFLKNPPILVLDETTFIIAHRLSTITHADKIVLIEHGEITESGTHQELMDRQGSYYDLFKIQQLDS